MPRLTHRRPRLSHCVHGRTRRAAPLKSILIVPLTTRTHPEAGSTACRRIAVLTSRISFAGARLARGGIAADGVLQVKNVDEFICLATQVLSRRWHRGDYSNPHAAPLHGLDQTGEIAIPGEQHHLIDVRRDLHSIDGKLDVYVAPDLAATLMIDEFFARLCNNGETVISQPIH